tara:strand:- start:11 stop:130 length:120 start_codon:yes stop_codon:yes gene_type:complete
MLWPHQKQNNLKQEKGLKEKSLQTLLMKVELTGIEPVTS